MKMVKIIKYEDAANILAYCHIDYDKKILEHIPLEYINHTCDQLILGFRKKYNNDELNLIEDIIMINIMMVKYGYYVH